MSEEPLANHRIDMTYEKDDYTVSDYVSHNLGITIGETCTCLTCDEKKQSIKWWLIYFAIGRNITERGKTRPISHEKKTLLWNFCVTMIDLMDAFYEKTELGDVICEECTKPSGTTSKTDIKETISTEITNATKNISSNIQF